MATRKRKGARRPAKKKGIRKAPPKVRAYQAKLKQLLEQRKKLELNIIELESKILTAQEIGCPWPQ